MKLQAAIDRVSLDRANEIAKGLDGIVDIVELGTSLVKDYGFEKLKTDFVGLQHSTLLLDGKLLMKVLMNLKRDSMLMLTY
ncbi:D-arabino-3-hexulose 6-phosphate formaldehyde-lyase [Lentilactobacillus kosonis]|uniref:D-arabino-3-hexulose 6-phosphate formaldehyde-lyase n=1 Tax=Lentilactobacillus kosonis TaxID=2810561 RepID=A0A401FIJ9_9LACO|nr:D-arabino-3-hexulose 6-phosphate formaldehyde-lyase [Lentilactobacillus kosonis]